MASFAKVLDEHLELLNVMVSQTNTASMVAATTTGPFPEFRDAVLFAATIGYAADAPRSEDDMTSKTGKTIKDEIFLRAEGATELLYALALIEAEGTLTVMSRTDEAADDRFDTLNRYAAGGFDIIAEKRKAMPDASINEVLISLVQSTDPRPEEVDEDETVSDPIWGFLESEREGGPDLSDVKLAE